MQMPMNLLSVMAGKIEDNGMLFANAHVLDDNDTEIREADRIDIGRKVAKVKVSTDNNNQLAKRLSNLQFPASLICEVSMVVKKNEMALTIVDFKEK